MSGHNRLPGSPSLRTPATKRIALPASQRLSTVTEGATATPNFSRLSMIRASTSSDATGRTAPPPYERDPPPAREEVHDPAEEEKLARLRGTWSGGAKGGRGGWRRMVLLIAAVLGVLGVAIGLGVGLTTGKKKDNNNATESSNNPSSQPPDSSTPIQQLPLGQYSFVTTLRSQQTNCTSNPATWRCYPYTIFSQSTFDWVIRNDSAIYATNATSPTPPSGVPANLTISSTNNPFALTFSNQTLTYHASNGNATSSMLTFAFTLPKTVVPTSAITSDNSATQCFFNSTILSGTIYLSASSGVSTGSVGAGSYEHWPYAVEVLQSSPGGQGGSDCYKTVNGGLGERVTEGLESVGGGDGEECRCEYSNY